MKFFYSFLKRGSPQRRAWRNCLLGYFSSMSGRDDFLRGLMKILVILVLVSRLKSVVELVVCVLLRSFCGRKGDVVRSSGSLTFPRVFALVVPVLPATTMAARASINAFRGPSSGYCAIVLGIRPALHRTCRTGTLSGKSLRTYRRMVNFFVPPIYLYASGSASSLEHISREAASRHMRIR